MKNVIMGLAVVLVAIMLCSSAIALTPMGAPMAALQKGKCGAGLAYSYSKMDLSLNHGFSPGGGPDVTMDNLKIHFLGAMLAHGVTDNWQVAMVLGGGSARGRESGAISFNSNNGYVIGLQTKATIIKDGAVTWGGLFQMAWAQADGKTRAGGASWNADVDLYEIQFAVGPTYRHSDKVSLYGGPFFHIIDGELHAKSRAAAARLNYDIDQGSPFGGYVGAQVNVASNTFLSLEYQHTAAADSFGSSILWAF